MKKKLLIALLAVIAVFACVLGLSGCGGAGETYYKMQSSGEPDKTTYFILKSGKWKDEDGESGTYKQDGDKIIFYCSLDGETVELCDGTLQNYVLTVNGDTYVSEKHRHTYGEWACNENGHWKVCTECQAKTTEAEHKSNDFCETCGYYRLGYELNNGTYTVYGIDSIKYKDVVIPETFNNLPVTSIGRYAFRDCTSLTGIKIPGSVTEIGWGAFHGCTALTSTTILDSVTSIENWAFFGCTSLTNLTIPNSVTYIGDYAFHGCTALTNLTIPNSVTYIGSSAFSDCSSLTNITIPESVTIVGNSVFRGCTSLKNITIPNSFITINNSTFYICKSLIYIIIPNSVTEIGRSAFSVCSSLASITIPSSVISIGYRAFSGCTALTSIEFKGTKAQWKAIKKDTDWALNTSNFTVNCTDGKLDADGNEI